MMRAAWILALAGIMAAAGCAPAKPAGELVIASSFYPVYIETINITAGVPGVRTVCLAPPLAGCLHDYQLTPRDMETLLRAEIFVVNGGGMESYLDKAVAQLPRLQVVNASEDIPLLKNGDGITDNAHVWVSVTGTQRQVRNIAARLSQLDPSHAPLYQRNASEYLAKLDALKAAMHQALKRASRRPVITMHEAFPYFAAEFGLRIAAVIEREPGSAPSAGELAAAIELVRRTGITVLFAEPQYPAQAAEAIARETRAKLYTLDPAVTGPDDKDAYLMIMRQNLTTLQQAFVK